MAKDPAFLFYPADASEDTQFMNRLERGCYFDLLKAQKKFIRFSLDTVKKVLGKDFDICWNSIEVVLKKDDVGYYIEWADDSIEKRKAFTESRRQNRSRHNNQDLFIYIMKEEDTGNYKIGSSVDPDRRLIEMQSKYPSINLLYSFGKTPQTTEAELHKIFSAKKIFNEFFELNKEDIEHIIKHMTIDMKLHMVNHMVNGNENENVIVKKKRGAGEKKKIAIPSLEQFKTYFKENGFRDDVATRAWTGYSENNWHDSRGAPVLNWKTKCQNVWFEEKNKIINNGSGQYKYTQANKGNLTGNVINPKKRFIDK